MMAMPNSQASSRFLQLQAWVGLLALWLLAAPLIGGLTYVHGRPSNLGDHTLELETNTAAIETLGRIVYLPKVTLQNDHNSEPLIFDVKDMKASAKTSNESYTTVDSKWFENSDNFKKSIGVEMGLSGGINSVSFSVESEFSRVTGSESSVKVAEVHAMRFHSKTYIDVSSAQISNLPLKPSFLKDFRDLPATLSEPHEDISWAPFRNFMNKWGSHIVIVAYTGAVYQSWSSSRSDLRYSQWQLQAKACVKAEGLKSRGALEVCAGYSQSEKEESLKLSTTDTKRVKGGTSKTRSELASQSLTPDLLQRFLDEDDVDKQPVSYQYLPVWDFFIARFGRYGDDPKRALALQAYYEGWKATKCPLVQTAGQSNNNAQLMVPEYTNSKQATGYYLCIRRCKGCHDYKEDCWYNAGSACCKSYGPSVLKLDDKGFVKRATNSADGWCDWDNGCRYVAAQGCLCTNSNEENGCNYQYPMNPSNAYWLKYKIIWNQHEYATNPTVFPESNPAIASVVAA